MYTCSIDLKLLPLGQRNQIMYAIKRSRAYYNLTNQVVSTDFKTMQKIMIEMEVK